MAEKSAATSLTTARLGYVTPCASLRCRPAPLGDKEGTQEVGNSLLEIIRDGLTKEALSSDEAVNLTQNETRVSGNSYLFWIRKQNAGSTCFGDFSR